MDQFEFICGAGVVNEFLYIMQCVIFMYLFIHYFNVIVETIHSASPLMVAQ